MKLLVVEDDPPLQAALVRLLGRWGYACERAGTAAEALAWLEQEHCDLVLLDLGLPDRDGLAVCRRLRSLPRHQPLVLILTARDGRRDKVQGLEEGADDYVVKPFDPELLRARLRALLRRADRPLQCELSWGPLRLQPGQTTVLVHGRPLDLTPKEALLLEQLLRARGGQLSKASLLHGIGDGRREVGDDALRAHMRNLRLKLSAAGTAPTLIETVYGIGPGSAMAKPKGPASAPGWTPCRRQGPQRLAGGGPWRGMGVSRSPCPHPGPRRPGAGGAGSGGQGLCRSAPAGSCAGRASRCRRWKSVCRPDGRCGAARFH